MTKHEFLVISLPYGIKCKYKFETLSRVKVNNKIFKLDCIDLSQEWRYWTSDDNFTRQFNLIGKGFRSFDFRPIVRPLSDLTKECVQADFNNGNPFYPRNILMNLSSGKQFQITELGFYSLNFGVHYNISKLPFEFIQILVKWHFDISNLIEQDEAIDYHALSDFAF